MSTALERRLQRAFARLPQPTREATHRARATAVSVLPEERRSGDVVLLLLAAAIAVAVGAGAAALAATGNLHVQLGRKQRHQPPPTRLQVPVGTQGIAIVAGGKLWLTTRRGLRIEAMPVSAAELSPRALYAVVGLGRSLVALAPGRRAWAQQTHGRVVAAAWSPDGLKIAYVVRRGGRAQLRLIEGDGDHDRLIDPRALPTKPSWRRDSLAVAYVRADGRAGVYDLGLGRRRTFDTRSCTGPAQRVAYSPRTRRLAVGGPGGLAVVWRWDSTPACVEVAAAGSVKTLDWDGSGRLVSTGAIPNLRAVAASPRGSRFALAVSRGPGIVDLLVGAPAHIRAAQRLLRLRAEGRNVVLSWR